MQTWQSCPNRHIKSSLTADHDICLFNPCWKYHTLARHVQQWDTDSGIIGIDNCCSGYMSHEAVDFTGHLKDCKRVKQGFGGTRHYNIKSNPSWHWQDDKGRIHKSPYLNHMLSQREEIDSSPPTLGPDPSWHQNQFQAPAKWQIINLAHFNGNKDSSNEQSPWIKSPRWHLLNWPHAFDNLKPMRSQPGLMPTMTQIHSSLQ